MVATIASRETIEVENVRSFEDENWLEGATDQQSTGAATDVGERVASLLNGEVQAGKSAQLIDGILRGVCRSRIFSGRDAAKSSKKTS